jgi:hypothetical protein
MNLQLATRPSTPDLSARVGFLRRYRFRFSFMSPEKVSIPISIDTSYTCPTFNRIAASTFTDTNVTGCGAAFGQQREVED